MLGIYSGGGLIGALAASRFHHHFTSSVWVLTSVMLGSAIAATASPAVRHAPPLSTHDELA
jgi:hypothetical protein